MGEAYVATVKFLIYSLINNELLSTNVYTCVMILFLVEDYLYKKLSYSAEKQRVSYACLSRLAN